MLRFKSFYILTSCLLLLVQLLFLCLLIYNKVHLGRVLYYGNSDEPNTGFEKYFTILQVLLYSSFALIILWGILTPVAVISNRRLYKDKINISIGIIGFFLAIGLLLVDPFGIFKWFTS
jgi:hypothetical protein